MGGHDHGHHDEIKIPDYKIYKVEDVPELMATKKALAAQGLSDPWLRNEVWRYDTKAWGTYKQRFNGLFFRGLKTGLVMFALTIGGTAAYDKMYPPKDHGHGHH